MEKILYGIQECEDDERYLWVVRESFWKDNYVIDDQGAPDEMDIVEKTENWSESAESLYVLDESTEEIIKILSKYPNFEYSKEVDNFVNRL